MSVSNCYITFMTYFHNISSCNKFHSLVFHQFLPGVSCINPPLYDSDKYITALYKVGTTIEFYSNVTYKCENGYYFEDDYHRPSFEVMCKTDGTWTELPDYHCVDPSSRSTYP